MPGPMGGGRRRQMGAKPKVKNPGKILGRILRYTFKNYKIHMIIVFICIIVSVLANVQGTLFIQSLIDDYITPLMNTSSPDFTPLLFAIARVAGFYLLGAASTFAYSKLMVYVTQGTMRNLRIDIFSHMESLPIKFFDTHSHGDIMSVYTNDIDTLRQMISQSMVQLFSSTITIVSVIVSMISISIPLTLLTLVMVAVMFIVSGKIGGKSSKYFTAQQDDLGKVNGYIEEMMNGQKVVKVFNHESKAVEEFNELNDKLLTAHIMQINLQIFLCLSMHSSVISAMCFAQ